VSENTPSFQLVFRPSVELISIVRRFVSEFYEQVVADADAAGRLALATHELLENAAKYTTSGETSLHVELDRVAGAVSVRTRNRTDPARIAVLRRRFDESAAVSDPTVFYNMVLRRSVLEKEGSGLGLARIRAEGEMDLTLVITSDVVEIHARALVARGTAP
jgi:two-component sensor histidine kinase